MHKTSYCEAILAGFEYVLERHTNAFVIGQGLWSPWYVGNSMKGLEKKFGKDRIIDSPVSELAVTGLGVGAGLNSSKAVVVHPRMDFMILALDPIVNQAAKWSDMLNTDKKPAITIRSIINRGGGQGAQHSQALHSWLGHIPGLNVLMPGTVSDARDLLIGAVLSDSPCIYIDDRWLYDEVSEIGEPHDVDLSSITPKVLVSGSDITVAAIGYSVKLALEAADLLRKSSISVEVVDMRSASRSNWASLTDSVLKTGRLLAVDGGWAHCGFSAEILAHCHESISFNDFKCTSARVTIQDTAAPAARALETKYYPSSDQVIKKILSMAS